MELREDDEESASDLQVAHLSERELLILALREIRGLRRLYPRVRSLENWRTGLGGAWAALTGLGAYIHFGKH